MVNTVFVPSATFLVVQIRENSQKSACPKEISVFYPHKQGSGVGSGGHWSGRSVTPSRTWPSPVFRCALLAGLALVTSLTAANLNLLSKFHREPGRSRLCLTPSSQQQLLIYSSENKNVMLSMDPGYQLHKTVFPVRWKRKKDLFIF